MALSQSSARTWQALAVVGRNDGVALVLRLHAREADAATDAVGVAQDARADHLTERREDRLQVTLRHVRRQVGNV